MSATSPRRFTRPRVAAVVGATVTAVAMLGAPASPVASASTTAVRPATNAASFTRYAVSRPVCALPTRPDQFTCMAFLRLDVPKGTPGAHPYLTPAWARGPAGGLTPAAIAEAYGINPDTRTRQTVAIVDWNSSPTVRADLNRVDRHYGLPAETTTSFRVVNQDGATSPLPAPDRDAAVEISLDVQAVRAVCHHCTIILVEANTGTSANLARAENTAVRLGADAVSNSFGTPEQPGQPFSSALVRAFSHRGVVTTASSGDNGWYFWDIANTAPFGFAAYAPQAASFPASVPSVVSVGGTRLTLDTDGSRHAESVWNNNGPSDSRGRRSGDSLGATGGGCSAQFSAPLWQRALPGYRASGCRGKRLSVDVSAVGDPMTGFDIYDSYGIGGWATIGGTSLSAPLVAGMWALAGGAHGMARPVEALYQNYAFRKGALHDVTVGGSGWCGSASTSSCSTAADNYGGVNNPNSVYGALVDCSFPRAGRVTAAPLKNPQCNAITGYDGVSGVGTPQGPALFHSTVATVHFAASTPRRAHRDITFHVYVHKALASSYVTRRAWSWGDGSGTVSATASTTHRYARVGTYPVRVTVTDNLGQRSASVRRITVS